MTVGTGLTNLEMAARYHRSLMAGRCWSWCERHLPWLLAALGSVAFLFLVIFAAVVAAGDLMIEGLTE